MDYKGSLPKPPYGLSQLQPRDQQTKILMEDTTIRRTEDKRHNETQTTDEENIKFPTKLVIKTHNVPTLKSLIKLKNKLETVSHHHLLVQCKADIRHQRVSEPKTTPSVN